MEEIETGSESTSDVSESASPDTSSSESDGGAPAKAAAPEQKQDVDWSKAFEHPRFKELVDQKNDAHKRYQDMESRYKTLEQQLTSVKDSQPKAPTEFDQLIQDLKKIDPRLAGALEAQQKAAHQSEALQARLDAFEKQSQESARSQQVQTAVAKINQMHESNKVSPDVKQIINDRLDLLYMNGKLNLQNLDQSYKEAYDTVKKYEESLTRSIRESYVKDKTKDATVPTSIPKGAQAKPAQKPLDVPKDKDALRTAVVKSYLKEHAASKNASNV